MSEKALADLYECFEGSIDAMQTEFTAHEFILHLAQHNQLEYVTALHAVRGDAPFQTVHGAIARRLIVHENRLDRLPDNPSSPNIFGERMSCSCWRKK